MRPKTLDKMTKEEFAEKMERSLAQARSGQDVPADEFLERLTTEIAEADEDEQQEILSKLEKLSDDELTIERTRSFKAIIAMRTMQKQAKKNGLSDMTLEEINAEIDTARRKRDS